MIDGKALPRPLGRAREGQRAVTASRTTPAPGDALLRRAVARPSRRTPSGCASSCHIEGVGVDPTNPPLAWEAWSGDDWEPCELDSDSTGGLNRDGDVVVHVPRSPRRVADREAAGRLDPRPGRRSRSRASPRTARRRHHEPRRDHDRRDRRGGERRARPAARTSASPRACPASGSRCAGRRSSRATSRRCSRCRATRAGRTGPRSRTSRAATPGRPAFRPRRERPARSASARRSAQRRRHAAPATARCRRRTPGSGCARTGPAAAGKGNVGRAAR